MNLESLKESELLGALSSEEQARADRFRFRKDRDQFVVGRSMMRALLGGYVGCEPQEIHFCYAAHGKPGLPADFHTDVRFNLSHSHELVLFAITRGSEIGIDVEFMRPDAVEATIVERVFSTYEIAIFNQLPPASKLRGFYNCWTRKEAFVKAIGEGLSMPLDQFDVSLHPGESAKLLAIRPDPAELQRWSLRDLELSDNYVGAAVVGRPDWQLRRYTWPGHRRAGNNFGM